jgi:hypothetical protein
MVEDILSKMDAGEEIRSVLSFILENLYCNTNGKIRKILNGFNQNQLTESVITGDADDNIELF